jgi:hypothetical protein
MADQFCPSCGTEVDADARFCPTCGTTLAAAAGDEPSRDQPRDEPTREEVPVLPEAPQWPPPADGGDEVQPEVRAYAADAEAPVDEDPGAADARMEAAREAEVSEQAAPEAQPPPPPVTAAPSPASAGPSAGADLPFTWPATVGGWLIGGGAALAAIALIPGLSDMISLFLFLALLGVAATVFLADRLPEIANLRLLVLVTVMIGLGVALDRAAFTVRGLETVLLIAMLAAAGGVLLVELDRDRPVPPPNTPRT